MRYLVNLFCISLLSLAIFADDSQINSILSVLNDDNGNGISIGNVIGDHQTFNDDKNYESNDAGEDTEDEDSDYFDDDDDNDDDDDDDESGLYKNDDVDSSE
ncbi:unnamed protein product [Rotaria magnacalcarata]|uniref:Uncharacterized protein n=1 Tax=Rotaria magnacalcarata TaxID=392030 RepID=A0A815V2V7_9BILA|nr:unnamed protein product [Rotaria magnacalcarata]CAF5065547.1 unnamed protein product [Rotaria magnacalcarata]CAF5153272.1 unnamed protein product [Rotaria magnacalcarata]